jgi:magnesium-transporting ATPase (P-type)
MLEYYNSRLERVVSPKRKEKVYKKVSSEIKTYNSRLYKYSFVQSVLLIAFYMIDLFVILTYFVVPVSFPYYVPYLTLEKDGQYYLDLGYLLVFILSFILFTPISLRRPKII